MLAKTIQPQLGAKTPTRRKDNDQRDGQPNQPACHQQRFASNAIRAASGKQVCKRLDDAEADDEGQRDTHGCQRKLISSDEWENCALQPQHRPNKSVDDHQQRELPPVGKQSEL